MMSVSRFASAALLIAVFAASPASAQTCSAFGDWATSVVSYSPGPGVTPGMQFGDPNLLLCEALGVFDVVSLGVSGSVTVGFAQPLVDGPGTDFITWENGFAFGGDVFGEFAFVEVSSNGTDFARFPVEYYGPQTPLGPFDGVPAAGAPGFCGPGLLPDLMVNPITDLFDPARAGGDAFDLSELASDPLVIAGTVDLQNVNFVRLVDVLGDGTLLDSRGVPIYDPTSATSSADVDAIAVLNHANNQVPGRPVVAVDFEATGRTLSVTISDAQGLATLDFATLKASLSGTPVPFSTLLPAFTTASISPTSVTISSVPLPAGVFGSLSVSIADLAGLLGGDRNVIRP